MTVHIKKNRGVRETHRSKDLGIGQMSVVKIEGL